MTSDLATKGDQLLHLYREESRPFLEKHLPVSVEGLDRRAELLQAAIETRGHLDIGFVGESQVGKSTLLNALIGTYALPSGGVGPLTAQAIHVRHSEEPFFIVRYHGKKKLNETRFSIERYLSSSEGAGPPPEDPPEQSELASVITDESDAPNARRVAEELVKTVEKIFAIPHADGDGGKLALHCLRIALDQKVEEERDLAEGVVDRIEAVRVLIGIEQRIEAGGDPRVFREELRVRAADWQSPLIEGLELYLDAEVLRSLHLVDLPGVGTINDPSQLATKAFVRTGDALAVVVRNNGITEAVVNLLERAEFITRWMWANDPEHPPIQAMVVVTHLDDVARGRYSEEKQRARENGERPPAKESIFRQMAEEMVEKIRTDLHTELLRSPAFAELDDDDAAKRRAIVESMCRGLRVHCVAAPDALELEFGDEDDAFLRDLDATGVPALRESLVGLAAEHNQQRATWIQHNLDEFAELLRENVERAKHAYKEAPEVGLIRRFRETADPLLASLEQEMKGLHGRCMSRLSEGIPEKIQELCLSAELAGSQKLRGMRRQAEGLHYQSLNAALRRSGRWDNRGVDFPGGITRAFVEKIAGSWTQTIVQPVRETLREVVEQDAGLVERLVQVALEVHPSLVEGAQVDGFVASMQEAAKSCLPWSKKRLDGLRAKVEASLSDTVQGPIANACEDAIDAGRNLGTGAKRRIIEVFEDSGVQALAAAREAAHRLLRNLYDELYEQLHRNYLSVFENPVRRVYDTITEDVDKKEEVARRELEQEVLSFSNQVTAEMDRLLA